MTGMIQRTFDATVAMIALVFCFPIIAAGALLVRLSSAGPAFYCATRVGLHGRQFRMYKLRSMHVRTDDGSSITAADDARVFPAGKLLRALKIDELPQLFNVICGDMAIVGPRPEAPDIVEQHYNDRYRRTLEVRPGLTSPGSVYYYRYGEQLLSEGSAEADYVAYLLPQKMQRDLEWLDHRSFTGEVRVIWATIATLSAKILRRNSDSQPSAAAAVHPPAATDEQSGKLRNAA
jgi:lipopolysaccharide/colanic/teichoic acid biosynthesis glycosyltransferase